MKPSREDDLRHVRHAARLGLRGHGGAEPNPLVGCVIVSPRGEVVGWGYHRRFGGAHAEVVALERAGRLAAGATVYVTLEPCHHHGKTGPCTTALVQARVGRVVIARRDPNPVAAGGLEALRRAGIHVELLEGCLEAIALSDPFVHRLRTGLPWVIAKWAQTLDGCLSIASHRDRWISGERSRRMVHRERGRVDAILTGIGTVRTDDPLLTARDGRIRRVARRVVVDPRLTIAPGAQLVRTASTIPTTIVCNEQVSRRTVHAHQFLREQGVELFGLEPVRGDELPLRELLRQLVRRHAVSTVLVEGGPTLLGHLFRERLVNEAWVYVAPQVGGEAPLVGIDAERLSLISVHRRGGDVFARYWVDG